MNLYPIQLISLKMLIILLSLKIVLRCLALYLLLFSKLNTGRCFLYEKTHLSESLLLSLTLNLNLSWISFSNWNRSMFFGVDSPVIDERLFFFLKNRLACWVNRNIANPSACACVREQENLARGRARTGLATTHPCTIATRYLTES